MQGLFLPLPWAIVVRSEVNLRHGVKHLTAQMRNRREGGGWDPDELKRMKDDCDHHGVILEAIRMDADYISLPKAAEREGQLDTIIGNIKKAADVGVKVITYHWTVIPIRRNGRTTGRGGSTYTCTSCSARRRTERPGRSR